MKQSFIKNSTLILASFLVLSSSLFAQIEEKVIEKKGDPKEKKEIKEVIITKDGGKEEKMTVTVDGDKVTVNGLPLDEYKAKNKDVNIRIQKMNDHEGLTFSPYEGYKENFQMYMMDENKAMLGVVTDKAEQGVAIQDITKESAAEKAGLKKGDVITKIDDKEIEDPDDLSKTIGDHKPGDKVTVTYLRDKKEQKATAELTKWKGMNAFGMAMPGNNFRMDLGDLNMGDIMPKLEGMPRAFTMPRVPRVPNMSWSSNGPKLGISVQDTEEGKGVKVIDVDEDSNAGKAGIKEDDIITEVDGKAVNGADEIAKIIRDNKDKISVMIKLQRSGKTQNIEVKMPRKLKTADL